MVNDLIYFLTGQASRHAGVDIISSVRILKSAWITNLSELLDKIQDSWIRVILVQTMQ